MPAREAPRAPLEQLLSLSRYRRHPSSAVLFLYRIGASAGAGWKHEAQMLAKCADHPNIVTLHEVMEDAHYVYIFMEECEGARAQTGAAFLSGYGHGRNCACAIVGLDFVLHAISIPVQQLSLRADWGHCFHGYQQQLCSAIMTRRGAVRLDC